MAGLSVIFKAVDEISAKFEAMTSAGTRALDSFDRIEAAADSSYAAVSEGAIEAAEAMAQATESANILTDTMAESSMEETGEALEEAAQGMEELAKKSEKARDSMGRFLPKGKEVGEQFKKTREEQEKYREETDKTKDALDGLDKLLATVGIVAVLTTIASAFTNCSQAAAEFETNVTMVSTVADTTALSVGELSSQISDLSMDTARNVNELADASYNAISAGVETEAAVATVGEASKLATAGFTTSSSALSVLTTTLNAYGLEASEVTNISDSLVTSQNLGVLTIDQMANSMGKAISTASAYSVDLYNLESGYISLTKAGISVEESTTYISSMFNELGSAGSAVATIITEETGMSFGQLMNAGNSLADVLDIVYESAGRDGEAMMNLWGSAEAGKAANAIINQGLDTFNSNLEKLENSAGTTQAAYEAMTNTTAYSTARMENSFNNLSIAIGDDLNPVVSQFQNKIADVTDGFTKLINKHPAITAVLTGIVVGVGAITLAITAYIAVTKIAAVASAAVGTAMTGALGPIMLVGAAVAALTAGVIAFAATLDNANDEYDTWTESTKRQYDELQSLNEEYEEAVSAYGETSEEALRLRYQIDDLSNSFETNKKTLEGLLAESGNLVESFEESRAAFQENVNAIGSNEVHTFALIQKLEDLASSTEQTAGAEEVMKLIIDQLNGSVSGLNMTYEDFIANQDAAVDAMIRAAEAQAEQERQMAYYERYVELTKQHGDAEAIRAELLEEQALKQERYNRLLEEFNVVKEASLAADSSGRSAAGLSQTDIYKDMAAAKDDLDAVNASLDELTNAMQEQEAEMADLEASWRRVAEEAESAAVQEVTSEEAVALSVASVAEEIEALAQAYDDAYAAALQSIQGQYGLWDEVEEVASMSSQSIKDALQSQIDYWNSYNENMASLTEKTDEIEGLSDMLADLADGSEKSAAMLAGMESMNDADLAAVVQQYNDLQAAQSETAASVAELETEFSENLENMQTEMEDMVDGMDLSAEAKANAKATMDAYVSEIQAGVERAQGAIDSLNFANNTLSSGGYHGYATGTLDAEPGLALVGEEGPELVNFGGGEVVYTAAETSNILARGNENKDFYVSPPEETGNSADYSDKTVTIRIEGAGEMKVGGSGVSKEEIVSVLVENIKGVLMNILQQEIMEEGEMSYEF